MNLGTEFFFTLVYSKQPRGYSPRKQGVEIH